MTVEKKDIIAALRTVRDPEIPVNLYDLGLIYELDIDAAAGQVAVRMTLTTPNCPVAETIPTMVEKAVGGVPGVTSCDVTLVWEPRWTRECMTEDARMLLEMMGIDWNDGPLIPGAGGMTGLTIGRSNARSAQERGNGNGNGDGNGDATNRP